LWPEGIMCLVFLLEPYPIYPSHHLSVNRVRLSVNVFPVGESYRGHRNVALEASTDAVVDTLGLAP